MKLALALLALRFCRLLLVVGGGIVPFPKPNNSGDAKLQMGKLLKRACQYCGAISGDYARAELGSF